jgi:hypothetical protein
MGAAAQEMCTLPSYFTGSIPPGQDVGDDLTGCAERRRGFADIEDSDTREHLVSRGRTVVEASSTLRPVIIADTDESHRRALR